MKRIALLILLASLVVTVGCAKSNDREQDAAEQNVKANNETEQPQARNNLPEQPPIVRNLIQLVLALQNYRDVSEGKWSVPYTVDPEGASGDTWRAILAPFLSGTPGFPGCAALVDADGFFTPSDATREPDAGTLSDDCKDGFSNIVAFVELADPESERSCITEEEFYEQLQNCPDEKQGYFVVMVSSEVFLLDKSATREQLHALVTINGGEKTPNAILK